jgi:hypothetical protein
MTTETRRFRAPDTISYAHAILALVEYARISQDDFEFGPAGNVSALVNNGLAVTGEADVVSAISDLLGEKVPGLYPTQS